MLAPASERWPTLLALLLACELIGRPAFALEAGEGKRARPALLNVPIADASRAGTLVVAADLAAGLIEALADDDDTHQRLALSGAASISATSWLNLGLMIDGRYDRHGADAEGSDDGVATQSELSARLASRSGALGFGLELAAWQPPGPDIGTSFEATSLDARAWVSHHAERFVFGGYGGYRLDRSEKAAEDAARLRFGDRVALGASEFDAVLAGVGVGYAAGKTFLFGEATAQLLLGSPELAASPCRLSIGARRPLSDGGLSGEVSFSALLTPRPDVGVDAPLMPIEPRAMLSIGLRFGTGRSAPVVTAAPAAPAPAPAPARVAAPPVRQPTKLELTLVDDQGQPLQRATVTLIQGERETPLSEAEPGRYRHDDVPPGPGRLRIRADGFQPIERDVQVGGSPELRIDARAQQALPAGQVRGLVRSFRGKPLSAKVRVEPAGGEASTDAEGFFQIDVPPGPYEVVIEAPGYQSQRRAVKVEKQGVVIVNVDLGQAP
jgi:hypothetical protein